MLIDVSEWRTDILEEHASELDALWSRRLRAPETATATMEAVGFKRIDARIDAHTDALVLAGEQGWPLIEPGLGGEEPAAAAAAAMVIASGGDAALEQRLAGAFVAAPGPIRDGLRAALELRAAPRLRAALTAAGPSARPAVAAAIWAVAAAHGERAAPEGRARWIEDPDAEVRRLAWRAEARFAGGAGAGAARGPAVALPRDAYLAAFADPDPGVRRAALEAAARGGQPWLLDELRRATASPSPDAVEQHLMLAILGGPADLAPILSVGRSPALGWSRFTILAACGRAQAVAELLRVMRQGPPVEAALAAAAFFRVTGLDVRLPERIPLVPEGTEAGELDEEIKTCDAALAEEVWRKIEPRMGGSRWAGGADADALAPGDAPLTLDLEARRALHLRAAFARPAARLAADVERFPFT